MDRGTLLIVLSLGVVLGSGATATKAAWVDSVPVSGATVGAASVDLKVNAADAVANYNDFDSNKLVPGTTTAGVMTVLNNGNVPLQYHADSSSTNADGKGLASKLALRVTDGNKTPQEACSGTLLPNTGTAFGANTIGSTASPRTLAAGASETVCVEATLPSGTSTTMQGATTNITFSYSAISSPASSWTDSVAVNGTTISVPTMTTPTMTCKMTGPGAPKLDWGPPPPAVTAWRLHWGTGAATILDGSGPPNVSLAKPSSGTAWVENFYGPDAAWKTSPSNTVTYNISGTGTGTCS